ncbi:GAF domain-containing protein, partial [bacterium]|nr:GAF domain-containing protein [bacterium]
EGGPVGSPACVLAARLAAEPDLPLPEVFRRVCEAAADAVRVERAGVWLFVNGDRALRCVSLFERSKRKHSKGACVPLAVPSEYVRAVSAVPLLEAPEARTDPRTAELGAAYLAPNGITSVLDAPLMRDDRLVGVLCCEHVGPPRAWTDPERTVARAVADLVVTRMTTAEAALRAPNRVCEQTPLPAPRGAAHDFRNVLCEILAHAELVKLTPDLPASAAARVEKLIAAVHRGADAMRELFSEPAPAKLSPPVSDDTSEHEPLSADAL